MEFPRNIVVIGCSRSFEKAAHRVPEYLKENGFQVFCVNPLADEIFGEKAYKKISDVPKEAFEVVEVFRPSEEVEGIAKELIKLNRLPKVFWMQEGIKSLKAKEMLEGRGVMVIEDKCMMKVHKQVME